MPTAMDIDDGAPLTSSKLTPSASFSMNLSYTSSHAYDGTLKTISTAANTLSTKLIGRSHLVTGLHVSIVTSVLANITTAWSLTVMVLLFFGDVQLAAALMLIAVGIATEAMLRTLIINHVGNWMIRRAKFAISKTLTTLDASAEADIMAHLAAFRTLYINNWVSSTSRYLTEVVAILIILAFSPLLFLAALLLAAFSKLFAFLDDYYLVNEQMKANGISVGSSASQYEEANRFFHNATSAHHIVVRLAHVLFSYMSPVIFFLLAAYQSTHNISLSYAMCSCVFYLLAARCHLLQHDATLHVIRNLYHAERVVTFHKTNDDLFNMLIDNEEATNLPYSENKKSSALTTTHSEKAGLLFTGATILALFVFAISLLATADMKCQPMAVTCGVVPTDGSTVIIDVPTEFTLRGCAMVPTIAETLTTCTEALLSTQNAPDEADSSLDEEEAEDFEFEAEALAEAQSAADAPPMSQSEVVTVAASFPSWSGSQQFLQTVYQPHPTEDLDSDGRRLTAATTTASAGAPMSAHEVDVNGDAVKHFYSVTLTVGTSVSDGSNVDVSASLVGMDGTATEPVHVGGKWEKGQSYTTIIESTTKVTNIKGIDLVSGGKNGLKFTDVVVDGVYKISEPMATMLKCRGSKRKGTYNCGKTIPLKAYRLTIEIGTGRNDKSPDRLSAVLIDTAGVEHPEFDLGGDWLVGDVRTVAIPRLTEVGAIASIRLITHKKNGLKIDKLTLDSTYHSSVASELNLSLKCSKKGSGYGTDPSCQRTVTMATIDPAADVGDGHSTSCAPECDLRAQDSALAFSTLMPEQAWTSGTQELTYGFGTVWNDCAMGGPVRFSYENRCDQGCATRAHTFRLSPTSENGVTLHGDCQQKNGKSYPKWCTDPDVEGTPFSMEGVKVSGAGGQKELCPQSKYRLAHDRGHQIPANAFDGDADTCEATNHMTNIQPQADKMNRGAWLKTEMMVECWRNKKPTTVLGGAVFLGDDTTGVGVPEWGDWDRTDWFMDSHNVKNPAYFWKVIVTRAVPESSIEEHRVQSHIAFWMPNHESAKASKVNSYVVTIAQLKANLAAWGHPEEFVLGDSLEAAEVWADPAGCNRM